MLYKREEPFRFHFQSPIPSTFKILKLNNNGNESNQGFAEIMDVSPNGLRFKTPLNLPVKEKNFLLEFCFKINDKLIRFIGELIWKKQERSYYIYGLTGRDDQETKNEIIGALKDYSKKVLIEHK